MDSTPVGGVSSMRSTIRSGPVSTAIRSFGRVLRCGCAYWKPCRRKARRFREYVAVRHGQNRRPAHGDRRYGNRIRKQHYTGRTFRLRSGWDGGVEYSLVAGTRSGKKRSGKHGFGTWIERVVLPEAQDNRLQWTWCAGSCRAAASMPRQNCVK